MDYDSDVSAVWSGGVSINWKLDSCDKECQTDEGVWHDDAEIISQELREIKTMLACLQQKKSWWSWFKLF